MKKVLVVEDFDPYFFTIEKGFAGKVKIMRAETLEEGKELFQANSDVDLIVMDACVPGDVPNSMSLVREIVKSGYNKPIIASSGMWEYRQELIDAGATHQAGKDNAAEKALSLLGL